MTEGIKSRDLLKCGEAISQGIQDAIKDTEQWRQCRERVISEVGDAALRAGAALRRATQGICDFISAAAECVGIILSNLPENFETKVALNEAPPRVRHLAHHSKKHRVRKKT